MQKRMTSFFPSKSYEYSQHNLEETRRLGHERGIPTPPFDNFSSPDQQAQ